MQILVWAGAALTGVGLIMISYCIAAALRVRRSGASDEEMRVRLQRVVLLNMVALMIAALGLMAVVSGVILS